MGYISPWVIRWVIVVMITVIVCIVWASIRGPEALWAPGHLSISHTHVKSCTQCHKPFFGPTLEKCIQCHTVDRFQQSRKQKVGAFHISIREKGQSCLLCHTEHQGETARITLRGFENPHWEFIFRATDARTCTDCHEYPQSSEGPPVLLDNALVRQLIREGEGAHRRGEMAKCLNCHGGGLFEGDGEEVPDD
jgi:hypothetical protein